MTSSKATIRILFRPALLILTFGLVSFANANSVDSESSQLWLNSVAKTADDIADSYYEMGWFTGSILLTKNNQMFFEKSYGYSDLEAKIENTPSTKFNLGSIMKNFTKVLILQQVESNTLSLSDTLDKFDLGFSISISSKVKIEHLLNHSSGFDDIFTAEYRENPLVFNTLEKKLNLLKNKPLLFEPGTDYKYSNYGYIVLGAVLEKITNQSFEKLLKSNIFEKIDLKNTSFKVDPYDKKQSVRYSYLFDNSLKDVGVTEHSSPDGGIESTASDVQKFYRELFYGMRLLNITNPVVRKVFAMDGERWSSYGGGLGVSAAAEVNITDGIEIIVLANADSLIAERISNRIQSFIKTGEFEDISELEINYAYRLYREKGKEYFYQNFKDEYSEAGYNQFIGRTINELGMQLLKENAWHEALDMFEYLILIFPNAPQAYDSLAFAYFKKGEILEAKNVFEKATDLEPEFKSDYVSDNYGRL